MRNVFVRKHLRRRPLTPKQRVNRAERTLRRIGGTNDDLEAVCYVETSPDPSQVLPPDERGFRQGHCSVVNIEPADLEDEVQCATTLQHEAVHTRQIRDHGTDGVTTAMEIEAHYDSIRFLRAWKAMEKSKRLVWCTTHGRHEPIRSRIDEVIAEEQDSIRILKREG
jgi:hypothetical protein